MPAVIGVRREGRGEKRSDKKSKQNEEDEKGREGVRERGGR